MRYMEVGTAPSSHYLLPVLIRTLSMPVAIVTHLQCTGTLSFMAWGVPLSTTTNENLVLVQKY